jgi:hypothetical protein
MAMTKRQTKRKGPRKAKAAGRTAKNGATTDGGPLSPKAVTAVKKAADLLWDIGVTPHRLLRELHEVLLLRCLRDADGNYAAAAEKFGPSRQSVQQYANSPLRDERWRPFQQNRRRGKRAD